MWTTRSCGSSSSLAIRLFGLRLQSRVWIAALLSLALAGSMAGCADAGTGSGTATSTPVTLSNGQITHDLAIAQDEAHDGEVWVVPGPGQDFYFLPEQFGNDSPNNAIGYIDRLPETPNDLFYNPLPSGKVTEKGQITIAPVQLDYYGERFGSFIIVRVYFNSGQTEVADWWAHIKVGETLPAGPTGAHISSVFSWSTYPNSIHNIPGAEVILTTNSTQGTSVAYDPRGEIEGLMGETQGQYVHWNP